MLTLAIPIFNRVQFLDRCMNSILAQTCREFEVILVDDGSTDGSAELCDSYAGRYPDLVRVVHTPNGGLSAARNTGIEEARGEFIVFPDSDDWLEPDYVESFLYFQRKYRADLVCLGHYVDTDNSSVYGNSSKDTVVMSGREGQRGLLLNQKMQGFCWNKIYRLNLIRQYDLHFSDEKGDTEDLFFTYSYLSYAQTVCHIPTRRVYHYYQHGASISRRCFGIEKIGTLKTFEQIISDSVGTDPELEQIAADELCTVAVNLLWNYENSGEDREEVRGYLVSYIRRLLPRYLRSKKYGAGRKLQAVIASISPRIYMHLKNAVHRQV